MSIINPSGKEIFSVTTELCGRPLTLEVNRVGFRTTGSVLVRYGDTVVLGSAQVGSRPVQLDSAAISKGLPPRSAGCGDGAEHGSGFPPGRGGDDCGVECLDADRDTV